MVKARNHSLGAWPKRYWLFWLVEIQDSFMTSFMTESCFKHPPTNRVKVEFIIFVQVLGFVRDRRRWTSSMWHGPCHKATENSDNTGLSLSGCTDRHRIDNPDSGQTSEKARQGQDTDSGLPSGSRYLPDVFQMSALAKRWLSLVDLHRMQPGHLKHFFIYRTTLHSALTTD